MAVIVRSLGLRGINGYEVTVECALSGGLPAFDIVGLPDAAVKESRERVRSAIRSVGARFPLSRVTINLAPAALRKEGTLYDLPILLGLMAAGGELPALDPAAAEKVLELTRSSVAQHRITCLMVTHNMRQALELGNRTLMMADGNIVLDLSGQEWAGMTVDGLLRRFKAGTGEDLDNDRILLSD